MIVYLICYLASFLFAKKGLYILSALPLFLSAVTLCLQDVFRSLKSSENSTLLNLRAVFSLSFVGGEALACLKLSKLSKDWEIMTWICFFLAYASFWLVFELMQSRRSLYLKGRNWGFASTKSMNMNRMFLAIMILSAVSLTAFVTEAVLMGFVPLFIQGVPHAYSAFHVSGVHYFTVSCVLVPAFSVVWLGGRRQPGFQKKLIILANAVALIIPVLCVSRFQFIFAVITAAITYFLLRERRISGWMFIIILMILIPVYVVLTIARGHHIAYLNSIFEMKINLPIFISQPYIYIANNYDNFNCLVSKLTSFAFGQRMLFPLWALTGLKFIYPELVSLPIFVTKTELTTVTLFYDSYYDFGVFGVAAFSALSGFIAYIMETRVRHSGNPAGYVIYAQFALYMALSFFTTWFSNPTTWFYFFVSICIYRFTRE